MKTETVEKPFDPFVFWVSATITIAFVIWSIVLPESMNQVINAVFNWTTGNWVWLYLITAFVLVAGCFVLMLGKYGDINPNVAKVGALQRQGAKGEAVAIYCDPLATQALECSGFPERVENMRKILIFLEFTDGEIQDIRKIEIFVNHSK